MSIMTVLGPIKADRLGIVLSHEHCFVDLRHSCIEPEEVSKKALFNQRVSMHNLSVLRTNPRAIRDNYFLSDFEIAQRELKEFKKAGGGTIVDLTNRGMGRDASLLKSLAIFVDVNIVVGCGYYTYDTHPKEMDEKSVEELADEIIADLIMGIKESGVKAGVIGELGISKEIHPNERKVLLGAAKAHRKTGAPIFVHLHPWDTWGRNGKEVVSTFAKERVDMDKLVLCHGDTWIDMQSIRDVLSTGVLVGFDNFGKEHYIIPADRTVSCGGLWSMDREKVKALKVLIDEGFERQILVSGDVCKKTDIHHYGGRGYDHILRNIVPMMIEEGIDKGNIDLFLKENPKKLLDIA